MSSYPCAIPGINLDQWISPNNRGWGAACNVQLARVQLSEAAISVNAGLAELAGLIMLANEKQGYHYRAADTGCYNCRKINGTPTFSWHGWGLAIDCNWSTNPMRYPVITDRPGWEIQRWNRYGWGWGGDYDPSNPPDTMHVEFHGTPAQAQAALDLARRELGGSVPLPQPTPAPGTDPAYSDQAKKDQFDLKDTGFDPGPVDGYWGPASIAACKAFQFAARLAVDGIMGPNTRNAIHKVPSWHGPCNIAGDGGYPASQWQQKLKDHGWHIAVDNIWGDHSVSILRQFQADKGITADGIRGPEAWSCLYCTVN